MAKNIKKKNHNTFEIKICGYHACLVHFQKDARNIVKAYFSEKILNDGNISQIAKTLSVNKRAYHIVKDEELLAISGTEHHEGICLVVLGDEAFPFQNVVEEINTPILSLIGLKNPHNLGAIIRSAAHFGIEYILTDKVDTLYTPTCFRIAEGGRSYVRILQCSDLMSALDLCEKNNIATYSTVMNGGTELFKTTFPEKFVLFMGEEKYGLPKAFLKRCKNKISIPGSGKVESLNVSTATAVILGQVWRGQND